MSREKQDKNMPTSPQGFSVTALEDDSQPSTLASIEPHIQGRPGVVETSVPTPSGPFGPEQEEQLEVDAGASVDDIAAEQERVTLSTQTTVPAPSSPSNREREEQFEADAGASVANIAAEHQRVTPSRHQGNGPISHSDETVVHNVGSSNRRIERSAYLRRKAIEDLSDLLRDNEKINSRPTAQNTESLATQRREASNESIGPSTNQIPIQTTISFNENMPSSRRNPRRNRFGVEPMLGNQIRQSDPVSIDFILHSFDDANHPTSSTQNAETPNETVIENRDPSLAPPHSMCRHSFSFLTVLETMMRMFHLEGYSEQEIETFFDNEGFSFHLLMEERKNECIHL